MTAPKDQRTARQKEREALAQVMTILTDLDDSVAIEAADDDTGARSVTRVIQAAAAFFDVGLPGNLDERIDEIATTVDELAHELRKG